MSRAEDFSALATQLPALPRPGLASHHSSSLPSTPYQHARKLKFNSRSPSPVKESCNGSPRSARSESDSASRIQGRGPFVAGCRFETGMAHSRRRIPYSIGGDQLERPSSMPKKYLNPDEEEKLSGDMRELYDRILPTRESDDRRARFVHKLEHILNEKWPDSDIKVHVFGSSGNMLCTNDSDVDICITTPLKALEKVCLLAAALAEHGMERVVCVNHAKVPIVKIWDPELQLACDMNVNNTLALENTRMIKTYVEIDERVRPLAMIIKYWTKKRILNDAALGGTLSSYTWICMILSFLQTRNPPVLPCLQKRPHQRLRGPDGAPSAFADDLSTLRGSGRKNKETLGELLFHFFRRYAYEIDYEKNVVSVREGQLISKEAKKWHLMQNNRLCVEEPFNTERNLGNTADDISFRGVHLEIRRAFDLISEARLSECTAQYEYPAVEEKFWEKPPPKPAPVLTRSQSQSGRGGKGPSGNTRGGRNSQQPSRTIQGRRASSAATTQRLNGLTYNVREQTTRDQRLLQDGAYDRLQLHEKFLSQYTFLQAQEQELRFLQAQAQLHAQVQAQNSMAQQSARDNFHPSSTLIPPPLTAPIRNAPFFHGIPYPPPMQGNSSQNIHTNPSSPSMKPAQPVQAEPRRRVNRSSAAEANSAASRSHSQPARPLPLGVPPPNFPPMPLGATPVQQYQQIRQQQLYNALEMAQRSQRYNTENQNPRPIIADHTYEDSLPKEYVGYYVHDSPPARPYRDVPMPPQPPPVYSDLQRYRPPRPDFSRLRNAPRSPSPSHTLPYRDRSYSVHSASSAPADPLQNDRVPNPSFSLRPTGPIIANGYNGWDRPDRLTPPDHLPMTTGQDPTSTLDEPVYDSPMTPRGPHSMNQRPSEVPFETSRRPSQVYHTPPEVPRVADLMRMSRTEQMLRQQSPNANGVKLSELQPGSRVERTEHNQPTKQPTNGLGIQYEENKTKVKVLNPEPLSSQTAAQPTPQSQSIESILDKSNRGFDQSAANAPLLSPVREVRSPSPSINIQTRSSTFETKKPVSFSTPLNLSIPPFSPEKHERRKQMEAAARLANGKVPIPSPTKSTDTPRPALPPVPQQVPQPQTNGWQQTTKKGKKKGKGHSTQASIDMSGEPIPANEYERKGG